MFNQHPLSTRLFTFFISFIMMTLSFSVAHADSAAEINIGVKETLKRFRADVPGGDEFLAQAKGVLVFPTVLKAGFGIGGEYGEGALQVDGKTVAYYSTAAASIGLQLGAQSKSVVVIFMTNDALKSFQNSDGWKAGVDGSVAVVEWGAAEDINTIDIKDPILGFVFSNKGLMYNLTLEGSKFTKLVK
ncbi:MAG: YSC84-related protein [Gammaproteobacteria bacterium]|nr:YSC84-related protein [Gammaproteobacteria bacterium]